MRISTGRWRCAYPATIRQRLIYVLSISKDPRGQPAGVIELKSVRLRKDDSFSDRAHAFHIHTVNSPTPAKFLRDSDMAILRRFALLQQLYVYGGPARHWLSGEAGAEVLERILATGRCRWEAVTGAVVRRGQPRRGRIAWGFLDDGLLKPAVSVEGGGTAIGVMPLWYIDEGASSCGPLEVDLPPRVASALLQAPGVHHRDVAMLRSKLATRLGEHSEVLPSEPAPAETIAGPPVPVLRLARQPTNEYESWRWEGTTTRWDRQVARLTFAYGPVVLPPGDRRDQPLFARGERLYAINRDRAAEERYLKRLHALAPDIVARSPHWGRHLPPEVRDDLVLRGNDPLSWPRFLVEVAPRLQSEGWRIEVEPRFAPAMAEADGDLAAELQEVRARCRRLGRRPARQPAAADRRAPAEGDRGRG